MIGVPAVDQWIPNTASAELWKQMDYLLAACLPVNPVS
jgi:hypothetical protein